MVKIIKSGLIGEFHYNEGFNKYEHNEGNIQWTLDGDNVDEMIKKAENLYINIEEFDKGARKAIATELIKYKNEFWPEYDENDKSLDWNLVDAGDYDITIDKFEETIKLNDIYIRKSEIYCEYQDGGLFGGHRIHACFDHYYQMIKASV